MIAGSAYGLTAPVALQAPTFYVHAEMAAGSSLAVPDEYEERAVYPVNGRVRIGDRWVEEGEMAVLVPSTPVVLEAEADARVMLLGGAPVDAPRLVWWNFVSSRPERIEQAKADWKERRFAEVPGETEFIPLPAL